MDRNRGWRGSSHGQYRASGGKRCLSRAVGGTIRAAPHRLCSQLKSWFWFRPPGLCLASTVFAPLPSNDEDEPWVSNPKPTTQSRSSPRRNARERFQKTQNRFKIPPALSTPPKAHTFALSMPPRHSSDASSQSTWTTTSRPVFKPSEFARKFCQKYFRHRLVGLAHLGFFAAGFSETEGGSSHNSARKLPPIEDRYSTRRRPFSSLKDVFNLRDEPTVSADHKSDTGAADGSGDAFPESDNCTSPHEGSTCSSTSIHSSNVYVDDDAVAMIEDDAENARHARRQRDAKEAAYFRAKATANGVLVLRTEDIVPGRWKSLSRYLRSHSDVTSLRLQGVEITTKELAALGDSLAHLEHITLCGNSIGLNDGAVEVLCATLLCSTVLESAAIERNSICDRHVPALIRLIEEHKTLRELSLCWNGIGDQGADKLAIALEKVRYHVSTSLRRVDLSYNCLGMLGRRRLQVCTRHWNDLYGEPLCVLWKQHQPRTRAH